MTRPERDYSGADELDPPGAGDAPELANLLAVVGRWRRRYAERVTLYERHIASLFDRIDSLQKAVTDQQAMINRAAIERADREDELALLQEKVRRLEAATTTSGPSDVVEERAT